MEVRSVETIVQALNAAKVQYLQRKRAAARPQDLADIADLERLQELKREFPK